jgi:hypothetical protein
MAGDNIDEVDRILSKMEGKIVRKADDAMRCQHGSNQKCTHCLPLDVGFFNTNSLKIFCI